MSRLFVEIGQPAIDNSLDRVGAARQRRVGRAAGSRTTHRRPGPIDEAPPLTRRALVTRALGATGLLALVLSVISTLVKGGYHLGTARLGSSRPATATQSARAANTPSRTTRSTPAQTAAHGRGKLPSGAVRIAAASQLLPNHGGIYADPVNKQPDIVIRHSDGSLNAFSAICTHQGCQVGYQGGEIVCPCHGGTYSASTGAVLGGPPPAPLARRTVLEHGGSIYAIPS